MENLSWEIGEVRKEGDKAYVDLVLTNKDLTDVTGIYEVNLIKGMIHSIYRFRSLPFTLSHSRWIHSA